MATNFSELILLFIFLSGGEGRGSATAGGVSRTPKPGQPSPATKPRPPPVIKFGPTQAVKLKPTINNGAGSPNNPASNKILPSLPKPMGAAPPKTSISQPNKSNINLPDQVPFRLQDLLKPDSKQSLPGFGNPFLRTSNHSSLHNVPDSNTSSLPATAAPVADSERYVKDPSSIRASQSVLSAGFLSTSSAAAASLPAPVASNETSGQDSLDLSAHETVRLSNNERIILTPLYKSLLQKHYFWLVDRSYAESMLKGGSTNCTLIYFILFRQLNAVC